MKILLLTDGIPPFVMGGMQKHSRLLAEYLALSGHQVCVYHYSDHKLEEDEVRTHFSNEANANLTFRHFIYKDTGLLPGHYLRAQKEMSGKYLQAFLHEKYEFDFIYTKGFMGWELLKQRNALGVSTPLGVKFHGMNMFQKQANLNRFLSKFILRPSTREILGSADYVFSYGGKITDIIKSECSTPVIEMPTGIDASWIGVGPTENNTIRRFLFIGRFDRVKGLPELYRALKSLHSIRSDWEFHIIGPIPDEHQLKLTQVSYHGAVYNEEKLKDLISRNDVLVNCSISEGMPNVILEAMACGLAIIATDVGATAVLVKHDVNGLLLSSPKPLLIQASLNQVIEMNDSELSNWKRESHERVKKMTWTSIGPQLEVAIQKCCEA